MMNYNIKLELALPLNALQQLIAVLDNGPHGLVRPMVDSIIAQATEQDKAARDAADKDLPPPTPPQD
jgi:2-keto-3-deoxy-L-rhamnonate aldolase RhmA